MVHEGQNVRTNKRMRVWSCAHTPFQSPRYVVMAYIVMGYIAMAYVVAAYIAMAYIVMPFIVMAYIRVHKPFLCRHCCD